MMLWALLLAFGWQSLLTQTHLHPLFAPAQGQASAAMPDRGNSSPYDSPANCPICREAGSAGPALLTTPVVFAAPAAAVFFATAQTPPPLAHSARSHRWQSRAPPTNLHA
jgi:hypothetical protein